MAADGRTVDMLFGMTVVQRVDNEREGR